MSTPCVCTDCGNEQDRMVRCQKCSSVRVVLISVVEEAFGPSWRKSFMSTDDIYIRKGRRFATFDRGTEIGHLRSPNELVTKDLSFRRAARSYGVRWPFTTLLQLDFLAYEALRGEMLCPLRKPPLLSGEKFKAYYGYEHVEDKTPDQTQQQIQARWDNPEYRSSYYLKPQRPQVEFEGRWDDPDYRASYCGLKK